MEGNLVNLNQLIVGDKLFDIPVYQRGYAWEEKNLQDLWEDLYYLDVAKKHYFGTVLLLDSKKVTQVGMKTLKRLDVIDGQQRLTTILILLREIISQAKVVVEETMRDQVEGLEKDYLRFLTHYKLNPLGTDGEFFRQYIINEQDQRAGEAATASQHRLVAAKGFFRKKLKEEQEKRPNGFFDFLVELKRKVDELQIIQYMVESNSDSIRIFETVNDRGRPLSDLEKTKSFLMHSSYMGMQDESEKIESRLHDINTRFSQMYKYYEDVNGAQDLRWLDERGIQRYHFINFVTHDQKKLGGYLNNLKDLIRDKLRQDPEGCVEYVRDYAEDLEMGFFAVQDMVKAREKGGELGKLLDKILLVGRLGNVFPLLMAAWLKFRHNPREISRILRLIEAFAFRVYTVGRYRSHTAQTWLYATANRLNERNWGSDTLIGELKKINWNYRRAAQFESDLRSENFYGRLTSRDMKYLLSEYEIQLRREANEPLSFSQDEILSSRTYQVEHIWPQSPVDLSEEQKEEHELNVHKLGNLTLTRWNQSLSNNPFTEKKAKYADSSLRVQRELKRFDQWNSDTIREREDRIVEFALKRWAVK